MCIMAVTKNTVTTDKLNAIVQFVVEFNESKNRGCPADAIRYVGGFSNAEIKAAKDSGLIKGTLGAEGGFYPVDAMPVPKKDQKASSLKSRMAAFIQQFAENDSTAAELMNEYNEELAKRKALTTKQ
jgi:hypothetical protein